MKIVNASSEIIDVKVARETGKQYVNEWRDINESYYRFYCKMKNHGYYINKKDYDNGKYENGIEIDGMRYFEYGKIKC
jgi:hypothetical protein